jgi:hypothetical protein
MSIEDSKIQAAFIRGYMNKCAELGFEKKAFIPMLLGTLGGGILGERLLAKYLGVPIMRGAAGLLARRAAARGTAEVLPGVTSPIAAPTAMGRGLDNSLKWLSKKNNARAIGTNTGMILGGGVGSGVGSIFEPKQVQLPKNYSA